MPDPDGRLPLGSVSSEANREPGWGAGSLEMEPPLGIWFGRDVPWDASRGAGLGPGGLKPWTGP